MKYKGIRFPDFNRVINEQGVSKKFIQMFYQAVVTGVFAGKENERRKIEARINSDVKAGQVRT